MVEIEADSAHRAWQFGPKLTSLLSRQVDAVPALGGMRPIVCERVRSAPRSRNCHRAVAIGSAIAHTRHAKALARRSDPPGGHFAAPDGVPLSALAFWVKNHFRSEWLAPGECATLRAMVGLGRDRRNHEMRQGSGGARTLARPETASTLHVRGRQIMAPEMAPATGSEIAGRQA